MDHNKALLNLERWAQALGGDIVEQEVLSLPAEWFDTPPESAI